MKILNVKKGFTTNSSGSYEWIPGISSSTYSNISISTTSTTTPLTQTSQYTQTAKGTSLGGWIILPISVIAGITAVFIIIKEIIKTIKEEEKK